MVPAIAMTLWADERKTGTIELLLTLPVRLRDAVLGKFLAAWALMGIALALTFPIWITVNYLGDPDNGVIFAAYLGSWFMAGGFLAIGSCMSAATKNSVIAFILTVSLCFIFVIMGSPILLEAFPAWMPQVVVDAFAAMGFLTHYDSIAKGVLDIRDLLFFGAFIGAWLFASAIVIEIKKAN
jgi:ABC-2 type transport system permease protein